MTDQKEQHPDLQFSELYQHLETDKPSAQTDEAILNFAKQRVVSLQPKQRTPFRWYHGGGIAASILILSVVWLTYTTEQELLVDADESMTEVSPLVERAGAADALGFQEVNPDSYSAAKSAAKMSSTKIQQKQSAPFTQEDADVMRNKLLNSGNGAVKGLNKGVLPECTLSLDGGFTLSNTDLGPYTLRWTHDEKGWLIKAINQQKLFDVLLQESPKILSEKNLHWLNKSGFHESYLQLQQTVMKCTRAFPKKGG